MKFIILGCGSSIGVPWITGNWGSCNKKNKLNISEKEIEDKILERNSARDNKNYELADKIRKELLDKGVLIEDKDGKTVWKFK